MGQGEHRCLHRIAPKDTPQVPQSMLPCTDTSDRQDVICWLESSPTVGSKRDRRQTLTGKPEAVRHPMRRFRRAQPPTQAVPGGPCSAQQSFGSWWHDRSKTQAQRKGRPFMHKRETIYQNVTDSPPSTTMVCPVIYVQRSEARKRTASAISAGWAARARGMRRRRT